MLDYNRQEFVTDEEALDFVRRNDITQYDLKHVDYSVELWWR